MTLELMMVATMYVALGAVVGFLSGLLGVGGGGILVPMLASIFVFQGMSEPAVLPMALGTSLACSLPTTATSAYTHHKRAAVIWRLVRWMAVGVIVGSVIGIMIATSIDGMYLAMIFAVFMMLVAVKMFSNWQPQPRKKPMSTVATIATGSVIGMISALISVGGAFFTILYLTYNNIDLKKAIGTSSAVGFVSVGFATIGYMVASSEKTADISHSFGFIYLPALLLVTITSVFMVPFGTKLSHDLPNKRLKQILGILCVLLSFKLLYSMIS